MEKTAPPPRTAAEPGRAVARAEASLYQGVLRIREEHSLTRLGIEGEGWGVQLERAKPPAPPPVRSSVPPQPAAPVSLFDEPAPAPELTCVESPIVGVFHEADPPVLPGQAVRAEEALGSIEALALRHEILSPVDGEVTAVQVEDGRKAPEVSGTFACSR